MDTPEIEAKVNEILPQLGTEGFDAASVDPVVLYAANAEKRRRDTQAEFTRTSQKLKKVEAVNAQLAQAYEADVVANLPTTEAAKLEELKYSDPDAWRAKIVEFEQTQRQKVQEKLQTIEQEASGKTEIEVRTEQLAAFSAAHPDFVINDDVIENDIPPRITNKLRKGEISFADFLDECYTYINKGKVIAQGDVPPVIPDLGKAPGGTTPVQSKEDPKSGYNTEIY